MCFRLHVLPPRVLSSGEQSQRLEVSEAAPTYSCQFSSHRLRVRT